LAVAIAPADGSLFTAGYLQSDTSGGVTFTSVTAANNQVVNGFAGQDGFLSKARESAPPCAALGAVPAVCSPSSDVPLNTRTRRMRRHPPRASCSGLRCWAATARTPRRMWQSALTAGELQRFFFHLVPL
jgi:hypothetical protein